jgi:pseudouridine synthase
MPLIIVDKARTVNARQTPPFANRVSTGIMLDMETDRLQKILARAGFGSRRACETIIEEGRVTVDGKVATLGDQADPDTQRITVDGIPIPKPQPRIYIMLHKPRGFITTTSDPQGRRTVLDLVDIPELRRSQGRGREMRLYPVGRLDADSEGLLLLTNDGALTQHLTHPKYGHSRTYRVLVEGEPTEDAIERWRKGVNLDGRPARFDRVVIEERQREQTWLQVTVHEGRNHLVRRMAAALGYGVKRLIRISMGPLQLGDLQRGKWRYLGDQELQALRREAQLAPTSRSKTPRFSKRYGKLKGRQRSGGRNRSRRSRR